MKDTGRIIVVIEDDAGMRHALQRLLRVSGFGTLAFESAGVARVPHSFVLDVQLPGMSGPRFYEQLSDPHAPAVFITSHDSQATRTALMRAGGQERLAKPFVASDLLDAISRAVSRGLVEAQGDRTGGRPYARQNGCVAGCPLEYS